MPPLAPSDAASGVPTDDELLAVAHEADAHRRTGDGAILRVRARFPSPGALAVWPLRGRHPLEVLVGFSAPADWRAIGVTAHGRAAGPEGTHDVVVTMLVGRGGAGAGLLRRGDRLTHLRGRPHGLVADACRRALGTPTAPPPVSTLGVWTLSWLDRVVEAAGSGEDRSWDGVARRHHACEGTMSPVALAAAARELADAWPWAQLRAAPDVLDLPGAPPDHRLDDWMDDGMWARWVLSAFPPLDDLLDACRALLPAAVADGVELVVAGADEAAG